MKIKDREPNNPSATLGPFVATYRLSLRGLPDPRGTRSCPSVEDHQSFVDDEPDQPTAKGALSIGCCDVLSGPVETIVYSNSRFVRIA